MLSQGNLQYFHSGKKRYFFMIPNYSITVLFNRLCEHFYMVYLCFGIYFGNFKKLNYFHLNDNGAHDHIFSKKYQVSQHNYELFPLRFFCRFTFVFFTITIALFCINNYLHQQCYYQQLSSSVITRKTNYYRLSIYGCLIQILYCYCKAYNAW